MIHLRIGRLPALALVAALAALCLAACGSSSNTNSSSAAASAASKSSSGAASSTANRSKLAACLKAHGITLPSRPSGARRPPNGRGGGFFFGGGSGSGRGRLANNPKLRAAFQACGGRAFPGRRRFTISHSLVNKFAACVKQHGYTLPKPNFSGKGPVFPASIEKNKKFQAAAKSCVTVLRPAGAPGPRAPGGGASPGSSTSTTGA